MHTLHHGDEYLGAMPMIATVATPINKKIMIKASIKERGKAEDTFIPEPRTTLIRYDAIRQIDSNLIMHSTVVHEGQVLRKVARTQKTLTV